MLYRNIKNGLTHECDGPDPMRDASGVWVVEELPETGAIEKDEA